ncbi:MAG: hypothetical protein COB09_17145 [Thalassobium sp.]|nr:MAG: hypothetical protein COB09_17145 [Thalassobium sp.]
MKLYRRKSDGLFPAYQDDARKKNPKQYEEVEGHEAEFARATHRLGSWTRPQVEGGVLTAYRRAVPRSSEELAGIDHEAWEDVRSERNKNLAETDRDTIRVLETLLPDSELKTYRQSLRDITDDKKNGGIKDPKKIKVKKFKGRRK